MNVNMSNPTQILQTSAAIGFVPTLAPKEATKTESAAIFTPTTKEDEENDEASGAQGALRQEAMAKAPGAQSQASQFGRISQQQLYFQPYGTPSKEELDAKKNASANGGGVDGQKDANGQPLGPRFDTGRLIQLQYTQNRAQNGSVYKNPADQAMNQKERFLRSFKNLVDTEYNQYVKSDDASYSKKNLREILGALNEQEGQFNKKDAKKTGTRDNRYIASTDGKGYNKLNQRLAGSTLQIFTEPPLRQPNEEKYEPLSLVA